MLSITLSNRLIVAAQWSYAGTDKIITGLGSAPVSPSVNEVVNTYDELLLVLKTAVRELSDIVNLDREDIFIAVDEQFISYNDYQIESNLSPEDVNHFIEWTKRENFGHNHELITTCHYYQPDNNYCLAAAINKNILQAFIDIVDEFHGSLKWLGGYSQILLENSNISSSLIVFNEKNNYHVFGRGKNSFLKGTLRFSAGEPKIKSIIGSKLELKEKIKRSSILNVPYPIALIDQLSERKLEKWSQFSTIQVEPFEGVNTEGINLDNVVIPKREQNVISSIILSNQYDFNLNFLSIPDESDIKTETDSIDISQDEDEFAKHITLSQPPIKETKSSPKKYWMIASIFLIVFIGYVYNSGFFTEDALSSNSLADNNTSPVVKHKELISSSVQDKINVSRNWSTAIIRAVDEVISIVGFDNISSLKIVKGELFLAWVNIDSVELGISGDVIHYSENSQYLEMSLNPGKLPLTNDLIDLLEFENEISRDISDIMIRKMANRNEENKFIQPLIIRISEASSFQHISSIFNHAPDNVIVKKIQIDRDSETGRMKVHLYIELYITES